jgi:PAS domain S-box-containing protein
VNLDLLEHILDISRRMAETRDLDPLLNDVMDEAIRLVGAERGYVVLVPPAGVPGDALDFRIQRSQDGQTLERAEDQVSRSILRQVVDSGEPLVLRDAAQDPHFGAADSVVILGLRSIMCVPLVSRGDTIGAVYVENRSIRGRFSQEDVAPLILFANQAAVAIENTRLFQALRQSHDELEIRVEKRTLELSKVNEQLKKEIAERKQADDLLRAQRDLGLALGATQGLEETLRLCVETAMRVSGMDCGGVYLVDENSSSLDLAFHQGLPPKFVQNASRYDADSANARLVMSGKPIYARHHELDVPLDRSARHEGLRAIAIIPVPYEGRVIACLNIASHTLDEVPDFARTALETIATQIGSAIARSKAEAALWQSQTNLQMLFDSLGDFLFVLNLEGRILDVNPVVMKRLQYSEAELLGETVLKVHPPDRHEEAMAIVADMIAAKADSCDIPLMTRDGALIPVETKITRGRWEGKEALFGISRDITERKRAEEAIQQLYEQTRRDAEAKTTLLREVNHRVKNNLTGIIGLIQTEQRYGSAAGGDAVEAAMERIVQRINGLAEVHDMLSQSEWAPVPLSHLANHVISAALHALPLYQAVSIDVAPSEVKVSPRQASNLALILNELMTNTVRHAASGQDAIHVTVQICSEGDDVVLLEYKDNGPGYPEDVLHLEHRGVGLYLVQNLVGHALNGSLALTNDGGAVTTMQFEAEETNTT